MLRESKTAATDRALTARYEGLNRQRVPDLDEAERDEALRILDSLNRQGFSDAEVASAVGYQKHGSLAVAKVALREGRGGISRAKFDRLKAFAETAKRPVPATGPANNALEAFGVYAETLRSLARRMEQDRERLSTRLTRAGLRELIAEAERLGKECQLIANNM